jgi:hypothetical protein
VSARTEAAFSALAGLDPLRGVTGRGRPPSLDEPADARTEACIARIIATSRPGAITAGPTPRAPQWSLASHGRRSRYGAIGLVASAAIAVIASLLWASPSAGAPPDQAITLPAQVGQAHSLPRP